MKKILDKQLSGKIENSNSISRRDALKHSAYAVVGTAVTAAVANSAAAQSTSSSSSIPANNSNNMGGRKFRAWVHREIGEGITGGVEELTLLPIDGRQVVIRTEASQCCYSNVGMMLGAPGVRMPSPGKPIIQGHGGVGVVEAVGPEVKRIKVGDRVIVGVTPECSECYNCLRGRADACYGISIPPLVIARTSDGLDVVGDINIGGHAELMVTLEQSCVAINSILPAAELAMLSCVSGTGLGMTMTLSPVTPGSIVAIFGAGPIGLSAVQGARLMGAAQIIVVEPISVRRELALKLGATTVFDPNIEGDQLVDKIRYLCQGESDSFYSGGRPRFGERHLGPDFVIEAVGGDRFPPKLEVGPDPAGILPLQQAWELCPGGSDLLTCGVGQVGNVSFPGGRWTNSSKNHLSSQFGGTHMKRDMPRYVSLIEAGLFDAESLATSTFALEETSDGYQATADRTTVSSVIVMS
ncbi:MAG: hypothetical protein CMP91_11080 [Gammaproteobacteria bacterium]|jgi:S-(hydroxymethyl)glutathione dehydrogenase/alcohol dehydrogenase|nr:hypothetical protein [Gammaproteobacteria bacterium]|tara:strand:- start:33392 stop:34795 length:1404 start_codon:yes stop_codon:yes gene_type:complete